MHNTRGYGRFLYIEGHVQNLVASLRSCLALHPADFRSWLIIFGLTADGKASIAIDARWMSGSDAAFDPLQANRTGFPHLLTR
jgi:hypothetical protein